MKPSNVSNILELAGISNASELKTTLQERGYDQSTINSAMRGYRKYGSSKADLKLRGHRTFKVLGRDGKEKTGSQIGSMGNDVSQLVGVLEDLRIGMEGEDQVKATMAELAAAGPKPDVDLTSEVPDKPDK